MIFNNVLTRLLVAATIGAVVVGSQHIEKAELQAQSIQTSKEQIELKEEQLSARLKFLKYSPNLGFDNLLADAIFVQFLQYFGEEEARKQSGYAKSPDFFEALISQDPYYREFYIFLSGSSTLYAGQPEKSVEIAASGLSKLSPSQPTDSYYVWRYKAVDELLFLGDNEAARKSFTHAAEWAAQSNDSESEFVSQKSQRTAEFLADNPDSKTAQVDAWGSLLSTALGKETRNYAIEKIEALGGSVVFSEDGDIDGIRYGREEDATEASTESDTNVDL